VTAKESGFISWFFWAVIGNQATNAEKQPAGQTMYNAANIWNVAIPDFFGLCPLAIWLSRSCRV
jgi:hypothetical protein